MVFVFSWKPSLLNLYILEEKLKLKIKLIIGSRAKDAVR